MPAPGVEESESGSDSRADRPTETPASETKARQNLCFHRAGEAGRGILLLLLRSWVVTPKAKGKVELGAYPGAWFLTEGLQANRIPASITGH